MARLTKRDEWLRLFALALAVTLVPTVWRAFALMDFGFQFCAFDLRGLGLDLAVSMWALVLIALTRSRAFGLAVIVLWLVIYYGSYQNVLALQAFPNLSNLIYLGDATFLAGSVASVGNWGTTVAIFGLSLTLAWWGLARHADRRQLSLLVAASLCGLLLTPIWTITSNVERWRQTNPIGDAVTAGYGMVSRALKEEPPEQDWSVGALSSEKQAAIETAFRPDLDGEPLATAKPSTQPNVLLIVIEGLSGAYLPTVREYHGAPGAMELPYLDTLHRKYYSVPNFVAHQRQTNRGIYSTMAGRLPNLLSLSPKMSTSADRASQRYLPQALRDAGYRTVFMQATDMEFMMMDQFMVTAGFENTYSDQDYPDAKLRTGWGVDDNTLFTQVSQRIRELEKEPRPWFLTALTCGSHHPYDSLVPEDFPKLPNETNKARAFRYADQALEQLLEELQADGVLDHTLVMITSDESAGSMASTDSLDRQISVNWGQMVVRLPNSMQYTANDAFGQSDIALSIVDYLGLSDQAEHFHGRSMFRDYATPRPLFFANNSAGTLGTFGADGELHIVSETSTGPSSHAHFDPRRIFALEPIAKPTDYRGALIALGLRVHEEHLESGSQSQTITLASGSHLFENAKRKNFQWVFGGQFFRFEGDTVLEFDVELTTHTDPNNRVQLQTEFHQHHPDWRERKRKTTEFTREMLDGERLHYRMVYRTGGYAGAIELNQYVRTQMDVPVRIEFSKAQVVATPASEFVGRLPRPGMPTYSVH
ncbi:MAG: LTA synthase family protein [Polyangiales bacterium]